MQSFYIHLLVDDPKLTHEHDLQTRSCNQCVLNVQDFKLLVLGGAFILVPSTFISVQVQHFVVVVVVIVPVLINGQWSITWFGNMKIDATR